MSETGPRHHPAETVPQALGRLRVALEDAFLQTSRTLGLTAQQAELLCAAMAPAAVGELAQALRCGSASPNPSSPTPRPRHGRSAHAGLTNASSPPSSSSPRSRTHTTVPPG